MNYLSNQNWTFPTSIIYGPKRIKELSKICIQKGIKKPLIVTDNGSKELHFIKDIKENLRNDNLNPKIFSNISPNPKDEEIMLGKSEFLSGNHRNSLSPNMKSTCLPMVCIFLFYQSIDLALHPKN